MLTGKSTFRRPLILTLLTAAIFVSAMGWTGSVLDRTGSGRLDGASRAYLENSLEKLLITFGVLSAVKVGLALVEGTEVGVGFGVQIGDLVQAAYDFVDVAWHLMLVCAGALLAAQILLQTAGILEPVFLTAALFSLTLTLIFRWFVPRLVSLRAMAEGLFRFSLLLWLLVMLGIPLSITGGQWLSERITRGPVTRAEASLSEIRADLFPSDPDSAGFWDRLSGARDRIRQMSAWLRARTTEMTRSVLRLVAGYLFDTVVFPLLLFGLIYVLFRGFLFAQIRRFPESLHRAADRRFSAG